MNTFAPQRFGGRPLCMMAVAALLAMLAGLPARAASVTEPATVLYGKVIAIGVDQPYLLREGNLAWTVRRADGVDVTLRAGLFPLNNGEYSYRLNVPHEALAVGLTASTNHVPLRAVDDLNGHLAITVNGRPARLLPPAGAAFNAGQLRRAATYRLDLVVPIDDVDSDGDGIPDWWEKLYGKNNALEDSDGDGWSNLAEYRNGGDPGKDNRNPSLSTRELTAYADGITGLKLQSTDADSAPASLVYTLETLPGQGTLYLRNAFPGGASGSDLVLGQGASFTQADVDQGRLIYFHTAGSSVATSMRMELSLRDENPAHPVFRGTVTLQLYRPAVAISPAQVSEALAQLAGRLPVLAGIAAEEQQMAANYLLSRELGHVIWDSAREARALVLAAPSSGLGWAAYDSVYVPRHGVDRRQVLAGGLGADVLHGSMEADVIIGNAGPDILRGHGGADVFVYQSRDDGNDVLEDFSLAEGDAIDLSRLLAGSSSSLSDYVRITRAGTNSLVGISVAGSGLNYTDLVLTVRGPELANADLYDLVDNGNLRAGSRALPTRVTISATIPSASENGPRNGEFQLRRTGDLGSDVWVNLLITGSAQNGVDYRALLPQMRLPAGQRSVALLVEPVVDGVTEAVEIVEVILQPGTGYGVGNSNRAVVTIEDLAPQIRIEVLEPLAVQSSGRRGVFLVSRSGVLDRSVLVRLDITGTAANYSDYEGIQSYVNLLPFQTAAVIEVVPRATGVLTDGAEFVQLAIRPDPGYVVFNSPAARVIMVIEQLTLAAWRQRNFPGSIGTIQEFAQLDPGQTGVRTLHRYAYGLDATNPQNPRGLPGYRILDERLSVAFRKPAWVTDLQYLVEVSEDLQRWDSGPLHVEATTLPEHAGQPDMAGFRAKRTRAEAPRLFMRVRVTYVP